MIWAILLLFAIYWVGMSIFCYTNLKEIFKKYRNAMRTDTPEKYNAFLRMDFGKWDEQNLLRNSYTVFPARMIALVSFLSIFSTLGLLNVKFNLPEAIVNSVCRAYGHLAMGFWITFKEEFDITEDIDTPIVIANHTSHIDILYFGGLLRTNLSYVVKTEIINIPLVGSLSKYAQTIYLDRQSVT